MNDTDLQSLAALLAELGVALTLSDAQGRVLLRGPFGLANDEDARSIVLGDGRRLSIGPAVAPPLTGAAGTRTAGEAAPLATDVPVKTPDRRSFEAMMTREWRRARRERTALGLLMVDVDQLESLAAQFGQALGDQVLEHVERVVRQTMRRPADTLTRLGREQFAVMLPNTAIDGAMSIAEIVRKAIVAADFNSIVPGGYPVTVSIGVAASVPAPGIVVQSLVHGADAALTEARRRGSNRVVMLQ